MKTTAFILTMLLSAVASAQQKPTTGYAPVNGLNMYYEVHAPAPAKGDLAPSMLRQAPLLEAARVAYD